MKGKLTKVTDKQLILSLSLFYFVLRLWKLRILPIFNDEATYIDWGWRMLNVSGQGFYSVAHAKTPLLMWIFGLAEYIFSDPLLAGRFISVAAGLATLLGLYYISRKFFDRKVAILTSILYIVNPLFSFFDRQALMESSVAAVGVWSFILYYKTSFSKNYKYAVLLGLLLGVGYFIKSNAFTFALAVGVLGFAELLKKKGKNRENLIKKLAIVYSSAFIILTPLIFNSVFWKTLEQNQKYVLTSSQLIKFPLAIWLKNIKDIIEISAIYLNPVLILVALYGLYGLIKEKNKLKLELVRWLLIGLFLTVLLALDASIRHVASFLPIIILIESFGFWKLYEKSKLFAILLIFTLPTFYLTILQITNPIPYFNTLAKISPKHSVKGEYVTSWPSGYGVKEAIDFISEEAKLSRIVVGVRLDAGNPENSVFAYFNGSKKVTPIYLDSQILPIDLNEVDCFKTSVPLYYVSRDNHMGGLNKYFTELKRFYKPEKTNYVGVHKLKEDCEGETINLF